MIKQVVARLAGYAASRQLRQFLAATESPNEVQQRLLKRQLTLLAGSEFAEDHKLRHVDDYAGFARHVPVRRFDAFAPYIDKLKQGRPDALFAPTERLVMFALTSGTTGQPKFIPVTQRSIDDYRRGWNVFGVKALLDHRKAFFRPIMQITSSAREHKTEGGLWAGAITGLLAETQKWVVRKHYVAPLSVAQIKDPHVKMYTIARLALTQDVSFTSTANPSTILRFARMIDEHSESLIRDIHNGELSASGDIPDEIANSLRPDAKCARRLEAIRSRTGRLLPKDVWKLEYLLNWTGGTLKLYLDSFSEYFGDVPVRDIGLLASEGRFSVPVEDHTPSGILEITGNFIEFIPEQEYGQDYPTVLTFDQVATGERYYLVLSNATGLTRYDIGDLVEVTGFYNRTPMIAFLSKGSHISSLTGEKLSEYQVVDAMKSVSKSIGKTIFAFLVCPHWDDPAYYALTIEKSDVAGREDEIAELFEEALQNLNIEYAEKRKSHRLGAVRIQTVADDFFANDDLKRIASLGRGEQYKRKFLLSDVDADKDLPLT